MTNLNEYIDFKTKQFIRTTGFNIKQENAKENLKAQVSPLLKGWVSEAIAAGC
jgi:hypothetical protein